MAWLKEWLKKKTPKIELPDDDGHEQPEPPGEETTPPGQPASVDLTKIKWLGKDYSRLPETCFIPGGTITSNSLKISKPAPSHWPTAEVKVTVQSIICVFYEIEGGAIMGGKFDWTRPGQTAKDLKNIHDGYKGHRVPAPSARKWSMIVDVNEKQRSNLIELKNA